MITVYQDTARNGALRSTVIMVLRIHGARGCGRTDGEAAGATVSTPTDIAAAQTIMKLGARNGADHDP